MFTNLKPYPAYGDSGRRELPHVPHSWRVRRLKSICRFSYGNALPDEKRDPGSVLVMGSNGPIGHHSVVNTRGETIVIGRKGSFGKVHYSSVPVFVMDTAYFVDCRSSAAIIEWLAAALRWLPLDQNSRDSAVPGLDREEAHGYFVPYPPLEEQAAIVKYLGHANARIDRAIAGKRKLIALLEEQKQAIINQAVTRGLDPDAPMKDSGIPWIGQIPTHWQVTRLGRLARVFNGSTPSRTEPRFWAPREVPWLSSGKVNEYHIRTASEFISAVALIEVSVSVVPTGSVVVGLVGQGKTRGKAAILELSACINQNLAAVVTGPLLDSTYLLQTLTAGYTELRSLGRGGNQEALNCAQLGGFPIPLPPVREQEAIAVHLDGEGVRSGEVQRTASREIELLREFRMRLTADVVTGQLDIRDAAARLPELDLADLVSDAGPDEDELDEVLVASLEEVDA